MMAARGAKPPEHEPTPAPQRVGAILWPSFFVAGILTAVFFTVIDPEALREITFPALRISRELGYSLGFFLFWLATVSSSLFTWILLRPSRQVGRGLRSGDAR